MNYYTVCAYVGAKYYLALILASMMVYLKATRFYDLFGGAANMILQKPPHKIEIYNDLDPDMCCLIRQLSRKETRDELMRFMLTLSYEEAFYNRSKQVLKAGKENSGLTDLEYAASVWFILLTSMNGSKTKLTSKLDMSLTENQFRNRIFNKLEFLERLEGIQVTNRNALDIIREETDKKELASTTMYYLDSPYYENNAGYDYDMKTSKEHREYCELLGHLGGYKMVSGYDNPVYQEILVEKYGFHKYLVKEVANNMQITIKDGPRDRKEEYVWLSYPLKGAFEL